MATSGAATFNPQFDDICETAFARCGRVFGEQGYDLRLARRLMNLLNAEQANRGLNLWTVEPFAIPMAAGQATLSMPADTSAVLDCSRRTVIGGNQQDISMEPMSFVTYQQQTNKTSQGAPTLYYVSRDRDFPTVYFWQVPDAVQAYTFVGYRIRRIQDVAAIGNTLDVPFRFVPAFTSGLAFYLGKESPKQLADAGISLQNLEGDYEKDLALAQSEDTQRTSMRLVPRRSY